MYGTKYSLPLDFQVQKTATKMTNKLEHPTQAEKLREVGLFSLEKKLFSVLPSQKRRGSGHKLEYKQFPLNMRKHLFCCEGD